MDRTELALTTKETGDLTALIRVESEEAVAQQTATRVQGIKQVGSEPGSKADARVIGHAHSAT